MTTPRPTEGMASSNPLDDIAISQTLPIACNTLDASISTPQGPSPIDKQSRKATHALVEERFEAAMQRRADFIAQFERDTGLDLDPRRRDSVLEIQHPTALAKANHVAITLLLDAWYERLGVREAGWTRYNDKTSARACTVLHEILENGDEEMGLPVEALENKEEWVEKLKLVKWWFFGPSTALDFLAAHGLGPRKIGSGIARVEVLNYHIDGKCLHSSDHEVSFAAWRAAQDKILPGRWPPMRPCGCYEYKFLMRTIANANGVPDAGSERVLRETADVLAKSWRVVNTMERWPRNAEDQNVARIKIGDGDFDLRFSKEADVQRGIKLNGIRLEGPWAELL